MSPEQEEQEKIQLIDDYQETFGSETGQRVLEDLMGRFFVLGGTHALPPSMEFNEGSRAVVLYILDQLSITHKEIQRIYADRRTRQNQRRWPGGWEDYGEG